METTISRQKSPFIVPEGYLDAFTERMMARIDADTRGRTVPARPRRGRLVQMYTRWAAGVAAALAFFFVLSRTDSAVSPGAPAPSAVGSQLFAQSDDDQLYEYMLMNEMNIYDYEAYSN